MPWNSGNSSIEIFMTTVIWFLPCFYIHAHLKISVFCSVFHKCKLSVLLRKHLKAVLCYANYLAFIFFKVNNIQNYFWQNLIITKSNFLLRDVYVINCYFCIFFCHFTLKSTFFSNQLFLMFSGNFTRRFHEATFNIFILFKK